MHNKHILTVICVLMICLLATGCSGSGDSATQDGGSSVAAEASRSEDSLPEEETTVTAITSDAAENIALDHSGVAREDVTYIHSYEEHDGGSMVAWCVEFEVRKTQYSYYVDMATGEILRVYEETHD